MIEDNFFEKVYAAVRLVPYGKLITYGDVAKFIGSAQSSRMVGWALNKSSNIVPAVPAHRVINRNGMLTGKKAFDSKTLMQELLEQEGHIIVKDTITDFEKYIFKLSN